MGGGLGRGVGRRGGRCWGWLLNLLAVGGQGLGEAIHMRAVQEAWIKGQGRGGEQGCGSRDRGEGWDVWDWVAAQPAGNEADGPDWDALGNQHSSSQCAVTIAAPAAAAAASDAVLPTSLLRPQPQLGAARCSLPGVGANPVVRLLQHGRQHG